MAKAKKSTAAAVLAEVSATLQVIDSWSLHLGYDLLEERLRVKPGQFDLSNGLNETADPKNQVSLRSALTVRRGKYRNVEVTWPIWTPPISLTGLRARRGGRTHVAPVARPDALHVVHCRYGCRYGYGYLSIVRGR